MNKGNKNLVCYSCGLSGHKSSNCISKQQNKLWCKLCKNATHNDRSCRKQKLQSYEQIKQCKDDKSESHSFVFTLKNEFEASDKCNTLLVDCGATAHIVTDDSNFCYIDEAFKPDDHYIELADGTKSNNIALKRGNVKVKLNDEFGEVVDTTLENVLYIPSYPQDIFSVQAATEKGAHVNFCPESAQLISKNGTKFDIMKNGRLYYLYHINDSVKTKRTLELNDWHKIMGHCNTEDLIKLEGVVQGMKIDKKSNFNCVTCVLGKQTKFINRNADTRASVPLELIHTDLCGPIEPIARDGFRYVLSFVDDYSSAIFVYFLKYKSDTPKGIEQFLADSAPYGEVKRIRSDNGGEFVSKEFESILVSNKIKHEVCSLFSAPERYCRKGVEDIV